MRTYLYMQRIFSMPSIFSYICYAAYMYILKSGYIKKADLRPLAVICCALFSW